MTEIELYFSLHKSKIQMGNITGFLGNKIGGSLLLLALLTACSSKSDAEELTKELDKVSSWAATAHMVGEAWIRGDVPITYAKQTLKTTQKELLQETEKLSKSSIAQRQSVLEPLQRLQNTIGQMSTAVDKNDRTAIATQLKQPQKFS